MKIITFILITIQVFNFVYLFGQTKTNIISNIRADFKAINKDTSLKKVILNNQKFLKQETDGGGQLTGFYKTGQLVKIVSWIGLSNGNRIFEYYFKNNKLIFIYEQFNSFVFDSKIQNFRLDTTEITFEGRYYFYNNKLIDQVTTGHNRFEDDTMDTEKTLLIEANENRKILEQKQKLIIDRTF